MAFSTKLSVPLRESTWTNNAVAMAAAIEVSAEAGRPAQTGTVAAGRHLAAIAEPVLIREDGRRSSRPRTPRLFKS